MVSAVWRLCIRLQRYEKNEERGMKNEDFSLERAENGPRRGDSGAFPAHFRGSANAARRRTPPPFRSDTMLDFWRFLFLFVTFQSGEKGDEKRRFGGRDTGCRPARRAMSDCTACRVGLHGTRHRKIPYCQKGAKLLENGPILLTAVANPTFSSDFGDVQVPLYQRTLDLSASFCRRVEK